jgi:hypothetical protein
MIGTNTLYDIKKDPQERSANRNPVAKAWLKTRLNIAMAPYRKRYEESRKGTPDHPFYYPIEAFRLSPRDSVATYDMVQFRSAIPELLKNVDPGKTWLLNTCWLQAGLVCAPARQSHSIVISAAVPSATYRIYALFECDRERYSSAEETGFRFRFSSEEPFLYPYEVYPTEDCHLHQRYYYLDLGNITVTEDVFSLEICFDSFEDGYRLIQHIKFVPSAYREREIKETIPEDTTARRERLKALGYL